MELYDPKYLCSLNEEWRNVKSRSLMSRVGGKLNSTDPLSAKAQQ